MGILEILGAVTAIVTAAAAGFAWLFRLETQAKVLAERIDAEREMRKVVEQRINGFEARIWEKLDNIEQLLHKKADRE